MGLYFSLYTAIFFGISNIFARKGLEKHNISHYIGVFINLVIVNLVNIPVLIIFNLNKQLSEISWAAIIFFMAAGFLNTFLGRTFLFTSIELIGPSRAGSFKIISPAFVVFIGVFLLGEKLSIMAWIGIITILLGVFLMSMETKGKTNTLTTKNYRTNNPSGAADNASSHRKGVIYGLLTGLAFGAGNIFRKLGINIFPNFIIGVSIGSLFALLCSVIFLSLRGEGKDALIALKKCWKGPYFFTGLFTSLGLYSFFVALQLSPVSIANSIAASESLFTMLLSKILLGSNEHLRINTVLRSFVIVVGLIILFFSK